MYIQNMDLARKNVRDICNHNPKPTEEEALESVMEHIDGVFASGRVDRRDCDDIAIACSQEFLEHYPGCQRAKDYLNSVAYE